MELEATLLACGFSEADAKMVVGAFLSGLTKVARSSGFSDGQKLGDALTEDQATEVLKKALDDRLATLAGAERARIAEMLEQKFGYYF